MTSSKKIILGLGLLGILGQLIVAGSYFFSAWHAEAEQDDAVTRLLGESAALAVKQQSEQLERTLSGIADTLATADLATPGGILATEDRVRKTIPNALLVRILPEETNTLDETRSPKMGYADLEMVHQATSSAPHPAVHGIGTSDAHIAIARLIPGQHRIVLASISVDIFNGLLPKLPDGGIGLRQDTVLLSFQGDPKRKAEPPSGTVQIAGSPWLIAYWKPGFHAPVTWWGHLISLFILVITGVICWQVLAWVTRATRADQSDILRLIGDVISGRRPDIYSSRLAEYARLAKEIVLMKDVSRLNIPDRKTTIEPKPDSSPTIEPTDTQTTQTAIMAVPSAVFRAYDIRGIVGETLTPELAIEIGKAIGSEAHVKGDQRVYVARDGRASSPELSTALIRGLQATGRTVVDLGLAPTPVLYFATCVLNSKSGVVVTGSHNPANYNGFKIVIGGDALAEDGIQQLRRRIEQQDFVAGIGRIENRDISRDYMDRILEDMQLGRHMKIVVDAGNGAAGKIAPALLKSMGCDVVELYCDIDSDFPNHHPDPSKPENLAMLVKTVIEEEADIGIAFDGDGDRLGVVDARGKIIWPDRQMMLFAADVLSRQPGADIIYDVKCSRHLAGQIVKNGGRPMMWKTGHSLIKAKMKQTGAMLAGEMSGHIFFKERWFGFDDGIYASARLIEILSGDPRSTDEVFEDLPDSVNTPELNVTIGEGNGEAFVSKLKELAQFPEARIIDIDGLRVDFVDGWGLVRASNTTPTLVIRFEADHEVALSRIQEIFREMMLKIDPRLALPF